mgnify:CR=1 FL=1
MTLCIGVWGNCLVFMFNEAENMPIKAGRFIHNVPPKVLDHDISDIINCETLGYVHKRGLAAEVCKIKLGLNDRLLKGKKGKVYFFPLMGQIQNAEEIVSNYWAEHP